MAINQSSELSLRVDAPKKRRLRAFLFFLAFSTVLWLFVKLADTYTENLQVKISLTSPPAEYWLSASQSQHTINLTISARGFKLLALLPASKDQNVVSVPLDQLVVRKQNQNTFYITSASLRTYLGSVFAVDENDLQLQDGDVYFTAELLSGKKVPVKVLHRLAFKDQFNLYGEARVLPDSLNIFGPSSVLDTIRYIPTKLFQATNVSETFTSELPLDFDPMVLQVKSKFVSATFTVEKFTEASIPIKISKPGKLKIKVFPTVVNVIYSVALRDYKLITEDQFYLQLDTNGLAARQKFLGVRLLEQPGKIKNIRIEPNQIEYILPQ